jgi:AraC family transcriptional regulator
MDIAVNELASVEAELRVPGAMIQIMRFAMPDSFRTLHKSTGDYRIDLCLTPRPRGARACFPEKWGPHRFEPVGDIFLAPPGHSIDFRGEHGRQASVIAWLDRTLVERWLGGEPEWNDRRLEAVLNVANSHIRALMLRLAEEVGHPGLGREAMVEQIAGQLAIELARYCAVIEDAPVTGGLAAWRLRLIDERLADLAAPPSLSELAELCDLSVRQLTRGFRASRGCTIKDFVARTQIREAKRLLAGTGGVKSIAFTVGFASHSAFTYAFRAATGVSPRQFRQRLAHIAG